MSLQIDTIARMVKTEWIQIRTDTNTKQVLETAAKRQGRTLSNYLIWLGLLDAQKPVKHNSINLDQLLGDQKPGR